MTRDQLIEQIVHNQESGTAATQHVNAERLEDRRAYLAEVRGMLESRLTEPEYLTCLDFDFLDVNCCNNCHSGYPHCDMWEITLPDGRHAWVCDPFHNVLMRKIRGNTTPEQDEMLALLAKIFSRSPDLVIESLNAAVLAVDSDVERLRLCIKYVHHVYGRMRGDEEVEVIVMRAGDLLGNAPATQAKMGEALTRQSSVSCEGSNEHHPEGLDARIEADLASGLIK